MSDRPTIALLIPAFNARDFLPRLIKSAAIQDPPFDEIWVHDDCSTDDTAAVSQSLGASVIKSKYNVGCTAGKARLLPLTGCEWVHFHDADDELLPKFTSNLIQRIKDNPSIDAIIAGTEEVSDVDPDHLAISIPNRKFLIQNPLEFSVRYKVNAICGIYRRKFLLEHQILSINNEELYNEDQSIQLNLVEAGAVFESLEDVLVRSYKRPNSMSQSSAARCARSHMFVVLRALRVKSRVIDKESLNKAGAERLWAVVASAAANGDMRTAEEAAACAISLAPVPSVAGGRIFRMLAQIHPPVAIRLREFAIRNLKPHLRVST